MSSASNRVWMNNRGMPMYAHKRYHRLYFMGHNLPYCNQSFNRSEWRDYFINNEVYLKSTDTSSARYGIHTEYSPPKGIYRLLRFVRPNNFQRYRRIKYIQGDCK